MDKLDAPCASCAYNYRMVVAHPVKFPLQKQQASYKLCFGSYCNIALVIVVC